MRALPLVVAVVALVVAVMAYVQPKSGGTVVSAETAYERVMRTGTLRCGYNAWEPVVTKDPATGTMGGMIPDLMDAAGKMADLKIEWTAEVDWGQISEALKTGKIDAFCNGQWSDARRGKQIAYSTPLYYMTPEIFVRADDARFPPDKVFTLEELNKAEYATGYTEGDVIESIAKSELPNVKGVPLPPLGTPADNLMMLLTKKTDMLINARIIVQMYERANGPGKVRTLKLATPLRVYGGVVGTDIKDGPLHRLVNSMLTEVIQSGTYPRIVGKYEAEFPGAFIPPVGPVKEP